MISFSCRNRYNETFRFNEIGISNYINVALRGPQWAALLRIPFDYSGEARQQEPPYKYNHRIFKLSSLSLSVALARLGTCRLVITPLVLRRHSSRSFGSCTWCWGLCSKSVGPSLYRTQVRQLTVTAMAKGRKRKEPQAEDQTGAVGKKSKSTKEGDAETSTSKTATELKVHPDRIRELRGGEVKAGPVIYWYVTLPMRTQIPSWPQPGCRVWANMLCVSAACLCWRSDFVLSPP